MANIDKVSVKNTVYNIVSPAVVSDYIEVIGGACTKPDGYDEDEVILAKQNDVQLLFKATQDIAFGANIVENTNCVRTTLEEVLKNAGGGGGASSADQVSYDNSDSGLEAENVQEAVDELATNAGTASSQIQTLTNKVANMQGVNLLDNPWFTVNQRGQSTYNLTENKMTVDRWAASVSSGTMIVGVSSNGLTITEASDVGDGGFIERINEPELLGKIVTISIDDGTNIYHATGTIPNVHPENWTEVCSVITSGGINAALFITPVGVTAFQLQYVIRVPKDNTAYTIRAVKLELGSVSTLAQDTAPNYATELLKCQRYFQRFGLNINYAMFGLARATDANRAQMMLNFPTAMKSAPTISVENLASFALYGSSGEKSLTGITYGTSVLNGSDIVACQLGLATSGLTANEILSLAGNSSAGASNPYINLSADL